MKREEYVSDSSIKTESFKDDDITTIKQGRAEPYVILDVADESETEESESPSLASQSSQREPSPSFVTPKKVGKRRPNKIWNDGEIKLLLEGIELYGTNWSKIASHIGNGWKGIQCKRRWIIIKKQIVKQIEDFKPKVSNRKVC